MNTTYVLGCSILLQFTAIVLALWLVPLTRHWRAWTAIAAVVLLMGLNCSILLYHFVVADTLYASEFQAQVATLGVSILMLLGIAAVHPLFRAVRSSKASAAASEQRFRTLADVVPTVILVHRGGQILFANRAASEATGYSQNQLLVMNFWEIVHPDDQAMVKQRGIARAQGASAPERYEIKVARRDGVERWVEVGATVFDYGNQEAVLVTAFDITERKQLELSVQKSEAQYRSIVQDQTEFIVRWLPGGIRTFVNDAYCRFSGRTPEELIGRSFLEEIPVEDREAVEEKIASLTPDNPFASDEHQWVLPDGQVRWAHWTDRAIFDSEGQAVEYQSVGRDITKRRLLEEELRHERNFVTAILDTAGALVVVLDTEGRIVRFNRACQECSGYTQEKVEGRILWDFLLLPEESDEVKTVFRALTSGDFPNRHENYWVTKDGGKRFITWSNTCIVGDSGELRYVIGTGLDITEQKRAEEERQRLQAQIQHAQKLESLGVLAGGIAHDFNNLLTGILGNASLALEGLSPVSPVREEISQIETAAIRAADLCKQMLAFAGKGRFVVKPIDLSELVREMGHLLQASISKNVFVTYDLADQLPAVEADASQIQQVVMNLITNASEAAQEKNGVVSIATGLMELDKGYLATTDFAQDLPEGKYVFLEVSDTGSGMDRDTMSKIFDPFFTTKFSGRGLGLAAVLGIVQGHNGTIKVYSEVGKGTTFKILLPAVEAAAEAVQGTSQHDIGWKGTGTVLVVDDEQAVLGLAARILKSRGFDVLTAKDGQEGVDVFREHTDEIVAVLLDMTMPRLNGEQAFREMRRIRQDVRVILSSGYNEQETTNRFAGKGLAGFVQKPYTVKGLMGKLQEVLGQ